MLHINEKILDLLSADEYYLLSILISYGKKSNPTNRFLQKKAKWGKPKLQRIKKSLVTKNMIKIRTHFQNIDGNNYRGANRYEILTNLITCSAPNKITNSDMGILPSKQQQGFVYVMLDKNTGYYKIGYSKNPTYRERTLQSEKPTIDLLFFYRGTTEDEQDLHEIFDTKRIRGEWFDLNQKDLEYAKKHLNNLKQ